MATSSEVSLTPKQQEVFNLLTAGKTPAQIAKKMGISGAGVYGHMRNMRKLGVILPNETPEGDGDTTPEPEAPPAPPPAAVARTNGRVDDPEASLRSAIERGNSRVSEIASEIEALDERRQQLSDEREALLAQSAKYTAALDALS